MTVVESKLLRGVGFNANKLILLSVIGVLVLLVWGMGCITPAPSTPTVCPSPSLADPTTDPPPTQQQAPVNTPAPHVPSSVSDNTQNNMVAGSVSNAALFPDLATWIRAYQWQLAAARAVGAAHTVADAQAHIIEHYFKALERQLRYGLEFDSSGCETMKCGRRIISGWPLMGHTMLGREAIANVRHIITAAARANLEGHFVEAGVWRGGASLYARFAMDALGWPREQWVVDSFEGLPKARNASGQWEDGYNEWKYLAVPEDNVKNTFAVFGKLDDRVHFSKGFFIESMVAVRNDLLNRNATIAVLRADGDMFDSTIDILYNAYDLVDIGGYIIIDDWLWHSKVTTYGARTAALNFRAIHRIEDNQHPMMPIGGAGAFWRKARHVKLRRDLYLGGKLQQRPVSSSEYVSLKRGWKEHAIKPWPEAEPWQVIKP